ncbi:MAG: DMT family transporter [Alphaproteobacteria bacterium]
MDDRTPKVAAGRAAGIEAPPKPQGNPVFAALWMLGALTSFATMAVAGREISAELDAFQLMFYRSIIGVVIVLAIGALIPGGLRGFGTNRIGLHLVRNSVHFLGQFCWFLAIALISLAEVFAIEFTTPIWVAVLAPLLLGERLTRGRVIAVALGFVGVLIILRPGSNDFGIGHIAMLIGAVGFGMTMIATKRLSATERPLTILFWMAVMQAPMGFLGAFGDVPWPSLQTGLWLVAVGVCGLTAHFSIAQAFRWADATVVAPMDFLRLPLIALVGMTFYAEPLDPFVFLGGAVVLAGNWLNIRFEKKKTQRAG